MCLCLPKSVEYEAPQTDTISNTLHGTRLTVIHDLIHILQPHLTCVMLEFDMCHA